MNNTQTITKYKNREVLIENLRLSDSIKLIDDNNVVLSSANITSSSSIDFPKDILYPFIINNEVEFILNSVVNEEEKVMLKDLDFLKLTDYIIENYPDESYNLEHLSNIYKKINDYSKKNPNLNFCFINYISTNFDGCGYGTELLNYLKEKYSLIILHSLEDVEEYWFDKVMFKELSGNYLYWSSINN